MKKILKTLCLLGICCIMLAGCNTEAAEDYTTIINDKLTNFSLDWY